MTTEKWVLKEIARLLEGGAEITRRDGVWTIDHAYQTVSGKQLPALIRRFKKWEKKEYS